ncbi:hypothetical protein DSECCO2_215530 [anaerobic digester metagenome]
MLGLDRVKPLHLQVVAYHPGGDPATAGQTDHHRGPEAVVSYVVGDRLGPPRDLVPGQYTALEALHLLHQVHSAEHLDRDAKK